MGSEYMGSLPDPSKNKPPMDTPDNSTQSKNVQPPERRVEYIEEPSYREHVSGPLIVPPQTARSFYAPYPPLPTPPQHNVQGQQPQVQYNGQGYQQLRTQMPQQQPYVQSYPPQYQQPYAPYGPYSYPPQGYAGYPPYYYPYAPYPQKPKRDGYLFGISIAAFVASILVIIGGFISALFLLLSAVATSTSSAAVRPGQQLSGVALFTALTIAGLAGGSSSLYHSIRSLFLKKPSAQFKLPLFWIFFGLYVLLIAIGFLIRNNDQAFSNQALIIFLIALAGLFPALTILSLAVSRVRIPRSKQWPTTWRRFTLAIVSGATSAIVFASIFELILTLFAALAFHLNGFALDNPNMQTPHDFPTIALIFTTVSIIAPLVEEGVKPLAVIALVGRLGSAAEAFILGVACGIGFDLIETLGYISQGYHDWLDVAIERSSAGLLHGFGAGMVALGWYLLIHKNSVQRHRILLGLGCIAYAVLQHAIWNGSFLFQLLPDPIGSYLDTGKIWIGSYPMPSILLIYMVETILMLIFFLYVTGKIRNQRKAPPRQTQTADYARSQAFTPPVATQG